jgi:uncharacterized protein (DUF1800 family)
METVESRTPELVPESGTAGPAHEAPADETPAHETPAHETPAPTLDRRSLFRRPVTAAMAALGGVVLAACDFTSSPFDRRVHLLKRLTYGATPAARDRITAIGETAWLDEQLAPQTLDLTAINAKIAALPALSQTPAQLFANYQNGNARLAAAQLQLASGIRSTESPAQLLERMVEFWSDHFNVPVQDDTLQLLKIVEDRDAIRPHALGKFKDLVVQSALSPAMLYYLDNYRSSVGAINENYGRELLELHTLGVTGGYTETDVVNTARLLTGWTINPATGAFAFDVEKNDPAPLTILGWTRPTTGNRFLHGVAFLQYLAMLPQCAQYVCTKIARRFVADRPDPGLVTAMANAWLANDSSISAVLRAMVAHPAFDAAAGAKFRRPLDYFPFALRALGASVAPTTNQTLLVRIGSTLDGLGQLPFQWPAPNGYPDVEGAWLNTGAMIARWNLVGDIVGRAFVPITYSTSALRATLTGRTAIEIYDLVAQRLVLESVTGPGRSFLNTQLGWTDTLRPTAAQIDAGLPTILIAVLGAADAQYR